MDRPSAFTSLSSTPILQYSSTPASYLLPVVGVIQFHSDTMTRIRKKMPKPASLGTILQQAVEASRIDVDLDAYRLWQQWDEVVGAAIAQNTRPEAIKGKLLLVKVSSAPWMQQLQFLKPELIEKLNQTLGKELVEDIRFQIGQVNKDT